MQLNKRLYFLLNILPYLLFGIVGVAANIIEFNFGESIRKLSTNILWVFWVIPIYIFILSIGYKDQSSGMFRVGRGALLSILIFVIGVAMMFGFTAFRIWLGMPI